MSTLGKIVGIASVVTGAAGIIAGGVTAQRQAVRRYRQLAGDTHAPFDGLPSDRSYRVDSADGVGVHVEEVGPRDAPLTVVFAHGWTFRLGSWHFQREALAGPDRRLVFFDQRSHGRSSRAGLGRSTLAAVAEDLAAVIATAAPTGPLMLVGHSLGGMAILELAARDPDLFADRVAGYALIDSSATFLDTGRGPSPLLGGNAFVRLATLAAGRYPTVVERARPVTRNAVWLLTRNFGFADRAVQPQIVDYAEQMIAEIPVDVILDFVTTVLEHDVRAGLAVLADLPGLILCGEKDRILPVAQSRALAAALPEAELVILPDTGHNPMLERPAAVNDALETLLARVVADPARAAG